MIMTAKRIYKPKPIVSESNTLKSYVLKAVNVRAAKNEGRRMLVIVDPITKITAEDLPKHDVRVEDHARLKKMGGVHAVAISILNEEPEVYTHHG